MAGHKLDEKTFDRIIKLVYDKSGIVLNKSKKNLVLGRLNKILNQHQINSYQEYVSFLEQDEKGDNLQQFIDAISTNVTCFYREKEHFEFLGQIFNKWKQEGQNKFRLWCAASSSGEEPYTIAITLNEALNINVDVKILATDISKEILGRAKRGVYEQEAVEPIDEKLLLKYFQNSTDSNGTPIYTVKKVLRDLLTFKILNLKNIPLPLKGPLDVIMCRNVMFYFDQEQKQKLANEYWRLLRPGGYLIISQSESLVGIKSNFKMISPSIYYKG